MTPAHWTRKLDWGLTGLLCGLSGVIGLTIGQVIAAWNDLATLSPQTAISVTTAINQPLQPFFPDLEAAEATLEQARARELLRREATRQQQLDQTREALAFHGSTTEDIEAYFIRQLAAETSPHQQTSHSN